MINHLSFVIDTKYGPKTVTGAWAVSARKGEPYLSEVVAEVNDILMRKEARDLHERLKRMAHERALGSMDPIWDDVAEMDIQGRGDKGMFPIEQALEIAKKWIKE